MSNNTTLKPCPYCEHNKPILSSWRIFEPDGFFTAKIECPKCGFDLNSENVTEDKKDAEAAVIHEWNIRFREMLDRNLNQIFDNEEILENLGITLDSFNELNDFTKNLLGIYNVDLSKLK